MVKSGIKIYARLKPVKKAAGLYEVGESENGAATILSIMVPKSESGGYINNKREIYNFKFNAVFDQNAKQDEIFESVARNVIDNCLEGYNGTIFAYGQTGSGKTFTITGGVERYADRGIIPRSLSYIFLQYSKSPGTIYTTHVSYMEIYNDSGYDLLDPKHEAAALEDLQKVFLMEGEDGNVHLKNLSLHPATNEEEALNWLFIGDTNRMIAETPMNMASTRSHCIFTIHISSREPGSDTIKKAKLHLVDLAGSERVKKTGVGGTLLTEAKYINLSLLFLEQVIVALSDKSRSHIPYRNSMMTSVLRDSLGGNCMTTMISTCSVEKTNIDETISTCRFSQRVALVKNEALLNEELDPKLMVQRLKQQVEELKNELTLATGEERTDELTAEEKDKCKELVQAYIQDSSPEATLLVGGDMRKIQLCFNLLKAEILKIKEVKILDEDKEHSNAVNPDSPKNKRSYSDSEPDQEPMKDRTSSLEIEMLQDRLCQRDSEIRILLKMLKQERKRADRAETSLNSVGIKIRSVSPVSPDRVSPLRLAQSVMDSASSIRGVGGVVSSEVNSYRDDSSVNVSLRGSNHVDDSVSVTKTRKSSHSNEDEEWKATLKAELSQARQKAFDIFRKKYADASGMEQHKKILKIKYAEAKELGENVNTTRIGINKLKSRIEKYRISRGLQGSGDHSSMEAEQKEEELKKELESEKAKFKHLYEELREMKTEIEHIQHLLQKSKVQIQREFDEWWKRTHCSNKSTTPKEAWYTPPDSSSSKSQETSRQDHSRGHHRLRRHQQAIVDQISNPDKSSGHQTLSSPQTLPSYKSEGTDLRSKGQLSKNNVSSITSPHLGRTAGGTTMSSGDGVKDLSSVGIEKLKEHQSLYCSSTSSKSWQPASSLSPPSGGTLSTEATSPTAKYSEKYKPKRKHLLPQNRSHHENQIRNTPEGTISNAQSLIPLTGDAKADADIIAFYKARQKLIQRGLK